MPPISARASAAAALLGAPTVLAFFSGGFFDRPRLIAGVLAWVALAGALGFGKVSAPAAPGARLTVLGLAVLAVLALASMLWAPSIGRALDDGQRLLLYLAATLLAVAVLRPRRVARWVEPALAAGATIVCGYALAGRLLPELIDQQAGAQALGRLDQPLTYWNALGLLAAIGVILCARLAAGRGAPRGWIPVVATAACVPLGAVLYLTFSRGAIAAAIAGLAVLVSLDGDRAVIVRVSLAAGAAVLGVVAVAFLAVVSDPRAQGDAGLQGAVSLGLVAAFAVAAAVGRRRLSGESGEPPPITRRRLWPVAAVAVLGVLAALAAGALGGERKPDGAGAQRLGSVQSERYDYWRVAAATFADHPVIGAGSGSFEAEWRRERPAKGQPASDAHSLWIETAAELGLLGLAALLALVLGIGRVAGGALRADRRLAVGPVAVLVAWAVHASLDWDWEMPAVTLPMLLLAGMLCAIGERETPAGV